MKYLVIADLSKVAYSTNNFLFGIFDTKEEAVQWIVNNPSHETSYGDDFNFFEFYEDSKIVNIYEERGSEHGPLRPRKIKVGERVMSKEEYAEMYIRKFDGSPLSIGWCEG